MSIENDTRRRSAKFSGFVRQVRAYLHAIVAASVPDAELVDRLALAGGAPEHFLPLVGYGAAQLAGLSEGVIELVDTRLTVRGTAISSRAYENVLDALDAGLPGGELDVVDIAPPRISPYVWKLERQGEAVTLTGNAPSRTARETAAANLRNAIDWLASDFFTGNAQDFKPLRDSLLEQGDPYFVLADFEAYCQAQARIDAAYRDSSVWDRMAILNTSRVAKFSSDRTISDYAQKVWNLPPVIPDA